MNEWNIALLGMGALVLVLGLLSSFLKKRTFLSEPLLALLAGFAMGRNGLDLLDPARWTDPYPFLEEAARLTIAIGVMAVALRLPPGYISHIRRPVGMLLGLAMPLMWTASSLIAMAILDLPLWPALLIGAIVTPTDPIVAASIISGEVAERNIPERVRHTLAAESGANDGLAYPFVLLPILVLTLPAGGAVEQWFRSAVLREAAGGLLWGAALGYAAGWLLESAERRGTIENTSFLSFTLALSLLVLASAHAIGANDILAVFASGITFGRTVTGWERAEEGSIQEAVSQFFTLPGFALIGLVAPWAEWLEMGWRAPALAVAILMLRRLPALLLIRRLLGPLGSWPDTLFVGWFGPLGMAAVYYSLVALRSTGLREAWVAGSLLVCASLLVHGVTASPLTKLYGRSARQNRRTRVPEEPGSGP